MKIGLGSINKKIVDKCYKSSELYSGSKINSLPQIILRLVDETLAMSSFAPVRSRATKSFGHSIYGTIIAHGPDIVPKNSIASEKIEDIAPTILHLLGISKPEKVDGKKIENMLR